jgi:integrase
MTRRARGTGSLTKRGDVWWIRFTADGKRIAETSCSKKRADAVTLLNQRLAEVQEDRYQGPQAGRLTFEDLAAMITDYYDGMRSAVRVSQALSRLREHFGHYAAKNITYDSLNAYKRKRRDQKAADGTVKYELSILRQAFNEALTAGKVRYVPPFPKITLENARTEFFTRGEFDALAAELPPSLRPPIEFAYWTGWRVRSEVLTLKWHQVDFDRGIVRLEPGSTKNKEGREFPFNVLPELEELLEAQRAHTEEIGRKIGQVIPEVFHRNGQPIKDYTKAWRSACERSKVLSADGKPKRPHDFRRTAVRRLERAGVSRSVAMKLVGHKTQAMYDRYAITAESDLREGLQKVAKMHKEPAHNMHSLDVRHSKGTKSA